MPMQIQTPHPATHTHEKEQLHGISGKNNQWESVLIWVALAAGKIAEGLECTTSSFRRAENERIPALWQSYVWNSPKRQGKKHEKERMARGENRQTEYQRERGWNVFSCAMVGQFPNLIIWHHVNLEMTEQMLKKTLLCRLSQRERIPQRWMLIKVGQEKDAQSPEFVTSKERTKRIATIWWGRYFGLQKN